MPSPDTGLSAVISTTAYANVTALQRVRVADVARIPQDLDTGQQFDITGRAAGLHHADAFVLVAGGVFGPVLLQRVLRRCFIAETGFLVAPENDGPACIPGAAYFQGVRVLRTVEAVGQHDRYGTAVWASASNHKARSRRPVASS